MRFWLKRNEPKPKNWVTVSFNFYTLPDDLSKDYTCKSFEYQFHQGSKSMIKDFMNRLDFKDQRWFNSFQRKSSHVPKNEPPEIYDMECKALVGEKGGKE